MASPLRKVMSGGQTGVDQAALRTALEAGLAIGGWCPPGRLCEDGAIPEAFPLTETPEERSSRAPDVPRSLRTEWNVRDSDATLVLAPADLAARDPGIAFTIACASCYARPLLCRDPEDPTSADPIADWLGSESVETLNVAGPSERRCPGIGDAVRRLLTLVFR